MPEFFKSPLITGEELEDLAGSTVFTEQEVELLYARFTYLDRTGTGVLAYTDLQMLPEFDGNPLSTLIFNHIESIYRKTKFNFSCFLDFLSLFSSKTCKLKRIAFLFGLFDIEDKGRITRHALTEILKMLRGDGLGQDSQIDTEDAREQHTRMLDEEVDRVLELYDRGGKGYLSKGDFARLYNDDESLEQNMLIDFSREIQAEESSTLWDIIWPSNK
ncbi:hypothetical protein PAPHI01_0939 [Pancytospora philotis]|nr:hypothetical protein PAPHI01_0939 [Pancytospora philotis]